MVQKYQNEITPIFYYGISTKTNEKDLKILFYSPLTENILTECPCTNRKPFQYLRAVDSKSMSVYDYR